MQNLRFRDVVFGLWLGFVLGQPAAWAGTAFDLQLLSPNPGAGRFLALPSPTLHSHLDYSLGLQFNYAHAPLFLQTGDHEGVGATIVGYRADAVLEAALGLGGWFELGVALPTVFQGGFDSSAVRASKIDLDLTEIPEVVLGDLRLYPHLRLFDVANGAFKGSLSVVITLPTAGQAAFVGEKGPVVEPRLSLGGEVGPLEIAGYGGFRYRSAGEEDFISIPLGNELTYGVGLGLELLSSLHVFSELYGKMPVDLFGGETSLSDAYGQGLMPAEFVSGVRFFWAEAFNVYIAAGAGVTPGYGVSTPRVLAGIEYGVGVKQGNDRDGDTVLDAHDRCPREAEDLDGFEDGDGCPEGDNDGDKILDEDDSCPNVPEDRDGFGDEDGCPEEDHDGDGFADVQDPCPAKAEDVDGFKDDDGCPDLDNDGDRIADVVDQCPGVAEDFDGFNDADGCPDLDNDSDGFDDLSDRCPNQAEDKDGVEDSDGCPEDDDRDGIPDAWDSCPKEAERYNLRDDQDGCPDAGAAKVRVVEDTLVVKSGIRFKKKTATLSQASHHPLRVVASVLQSYRHITQLTIAVHVFRAGSREKNQALSLKRAQAVRSFLIEQGVHPSRLVAEGVGEPRPLRRGRSARALRRNERVEFIIETRAPLGFGYEQASEEEPLFEVGPDLDESKGSGADNEPEIEFNF